MCMRYYIDRTAKELDEVVTKALATKTYLSFSRISYPLVTDGEIKPTNVVPVIAPSPKGVPQVYAMKWGFDVPGKILPIFNARSETARIRPTFKEGWERHRCIVPASYYFEWEGDEDEGGGGGDEDMGDMDFGGGDEGGGDEGGGDEGGGEEPPM